MSIHYTKPLEGEWIGMHAGKQAAVRTKKYRRFSIGVDSSHNMKHGPKYAPNGRYVRACVRVYAFMTDPKEC